MWLNFTSVHNIIDEELASLVFVNLGLDYLPGGGHVHGAVVNVFQKYILVVVHVTIVGWLRG